MAAGFLSLVEAARRASQGLSMLGSVLSTLTRPTIRMTNYSQKAIGAAREAHSASEQE